MVSAPSTRPHASAKLVRSIPQTTEQVVPPGISENKDRGHAEAAGDTDVNIQTASSWNAPLSSDSMS